VKESTNMRTQVSKDLHFKVSNKCKFYDIKIQDVLTNLLQRFVDGEFDKDFNIIAK
jgi:hypothetical protein